ncbi:MAG: hypothetical protein SNJ84_06795, partial [Verrucomicrobiia bacterium]
MKLTASFVLGSAWLVAVGWVLSAVGGLKLGLYAPLMLVGLGFVWGWNRRVRWPQTRFRWRRFRQWPACGFAGAALLALAGGLLNDPANFDGLSYRGSRVLHWISEGSWHWIHTPNERMNTRGTVFEWLSVPFYMGLRSDRLLFLINWFGFLLLPGLIFRFLRGCGLAGRAAWWWMWILPLGLGYVLQAGSIGNDALGAVYFLAALVFLMPERGQRLGPSALVLSVLAIGLTTGLKATNMVFGLPWLVLLLGQWRSVAKHACTLLAVAPLGLLVSFVPTAVLNHYHCGDWTGMKAENDEIRLKDPIAGLLGNGVLLLVQNVQPPVFPGAGGASGILDAVLPERIREAFPQRAFGFAEMQMERS